MDLSIENKIVRYNRGEIEELDDFLIREYALTIFLNEKEFLTLLCSPQSLNYLTVGFLVSEGLLKKPEEIKEIEVAAEDGVVRVETNKKLDMREKLHGKRTLTTGCGKGTVFYNVLDSLGTKKLNKDNLKIGAEEVLTLIKKMSRQSELFKQTGGVHSCCLAKQEEILIFHEDVGRHNAVDKVIGEAFMKGNDLQDKILLTSGRISSEMLLKAAKQEIPIVASRSAPTNLTVKIAEELNLTVIGFARGRRLNVYTHSDRIDFNE
ncbi:formate dehydrogenase accessory sulfurtransferase FdhD [Natroniella sulfidigena]|uniref:formate dehydrogenase accessory sulfurtransferase FdhD n=1 Tax=Natroniella sulfidigena TaxID=723921 RepID=UPI00200A9D0C|nr:formate dehydrogenase accessory sulfurtransferase FdhD [Natroniella sulfidigena]MCK8817253.1 formate dehydrogenase accessory sulfurtransferase FdhD [Natroniella sulfidigena]